MWTERAWMGYSLAASIGLIGVALIVEHLRANPLINTRWLGRESSCGSCWSPPRVRILLSEQAFGSLAC